MIKKIPTKVLKKWKRYWWLEKWFLVYIIILILTLLFVPILEKQTFDAINTETVIENIYIFNSNMIMIDIVVGFLLIILLLRNSSFRFKKSISTIIWFKENEALLNFWIIFIIWIIIISIFNVISLLIANNYIDLISIPYSSSIIFWMVLWLWLIWNIFIWMNNVNNRKRNNTINIINQRTHEEIEDTKGIRWLFDE